MTGGRLRPGSYGAAERGGGGAVTGRWADKEIPAVFQALEQEDALADLPQLNTSGCWDAPDGHSAHPV